LLRTNFSDVVEGLVFHVGSCIESNYSLNYALRRMRWAGHVARMGGLGMHIGIGGKARRKETTR
jgi:hypothetical protein